MISIVLILAGVVPASAGPSTLPGLQERVRLSEIERDLLLLFRKNACWRPGHHNLSVGFRENAPIGELRLFSNWKLGIVSTDRGERPGSRVLEGLSWMKQLGADRTDRWSAGSGIEVTRLQESWVDRYNEAENAVRKFALTSIVNIVADDLVETNELRQLINALWSSGQFDAARRLAGENAMTPWEGHMLLAHLEAKDQFGVALTGAMRAAREAPSRYRTSQYVDDLLDRAVLESAGHVDAAVARFGLRNLHGLIPFLANPQLMPKGIRQLLVDFVATVDEQSSEGSPNLRWYVLARVILIWLDGQVGTQDLGASMIPDMSRLLDWPLLQFVYFLRDSESEPPDGPFHELSDDVAQELRELLEVLSSIEEQDVLTQLCQFALLWALDDTDELIAFRQRFDFSWTAVDLWVGAVLGTYFVDRDAEALETYFERHRSWMPAELAAELIVGVLLHHSPHPIPLRSQLGLLELAVELDPAFSWAWYMLALKHLEMRPGSVSGPAVQALRRTDEIADPQIIGYRSLLAAILAWEKGDLSGVEESLFTALAHAGSDTKTQAAASALQCVLAVRRLEEQRVCADLALLAIHRARVLHRDKPRNLTLSAVQTRASVLRGSLSALDLLAASMRGRFGETSTLYGELASELARLHMEVARNGSRDAKQRALERCVHALKIWPDNAVSRLQVWSFVLTFVPGALSPDLLRAFEQPLSEALARTNGRGLEEFRAVLLHDALTGDGRAFASGLVAFLDLLDEMYPEAGAQRQAARRLPFAVVDRGWGAILASQETGELPVTAAADLAKRMLRFTASDSAVPSWTCLMAAFLLGLPGLDEDDLSRVRENAERLAELHLDASTAPQKATDEELATALVRFGSSKAGAEADARMRPELEVR